MDESEADVEGRMRIMSNQIARMKLFAEKKLTRIIKDNDMMDATLTSMMNSIMRIL